MQLTSGSGIKSIQSGQFSQTPNTIDDIVINQVNVERAIVVSSSYQASPDDIPAVYLLDSTTLRIHRENAGGSNFVAWQVVEYN